MSQSQTLYGTTSKPLEENKRPIVALDLDEVVIEGFVEGLLNQYNDEYFDRLRIEDITDYQIDKFLKPECKFFFKEFATKTFFKQLSISPETVRAITELEKACDVIYLTAAHPTTIRARDKLLNKYIPSYHSGQLVVCRNKSLLDGNIFALVDDCFNNIRDLHCIGILKNMPWNTKYAYPNRADNLTQAVELIYEAWETKKRYEQGR